MYRLPFKTTPKRGDNCCRVPSHRTTRQEDSWRQNTLTCKLYACVYTHHYDCNMYKWCTVWLTICVRIYVYVYECVCAYVYYVFMYVCVYGLRM